MLETIRIKETYNNFIDWLKVFVAYPDHKMIGKPIDDVKTFYAVGQVQPQPRYGNRRRVELYTTNVLEMQHYPGGEKYLYPVNRQPVAIEATIEEFTGRLLIDLTCSDDRLDEVYFKMLQAIVERWPEALPEEKKGSAQDDGKSGPAEWRIKRANIFKDIKDRFPRYTYEEVANHAEKNYEGELGPNLVNWETVKNDYEDIGADLGWKWQRGERGRNR